MPLYAIYVCYALTQGCQHEQGRHPEFDTLAPCQAEEKRLNADVKPGSPISFRCKKFAGPTVPM